MRLVCLRGGLATRLGLVVTLPLCCLATTHGVTERYSLGAQDDINDLSTLLCAPNSKTTQLISRIQISLGMRLHNIGLRHRNLT